MNWFQIFKKTADSLQTTPMPQSQPSPKTKSRLGPAGGRAFDSLRQLNNTQPAEPAKVEFKQPSPQEHQLAEKYYTYLRKTMQRDSSDEAMAMKTMDQQFGHYPEFIQMKNAFMDVETYQKQFAKTHQDEIGTQSMPLLLDQ